MGAQRIQAGLLEIIYHSEVTLTKQLQDKTTDFYIIVQSGCYCRTLNQTHYRYNIRATSVAVVATCIIYRRHFFKVTDRCFRLAVLKLHPPPLSPSGSRMPWSTWLRSGRPSSTSCCENEDSGAPPSAPTWTSLCWRWLRAPVGWGRRWSAMTCSISTTRTSLRWRQTPTQLRYSALDLGYYFMFPRSS